MTARQAAPPLPGRRRRVRRTRRFIATSVITFALLIDGFMGSSAWAVDPQPSPTGGQVAGLTVHPSWENAPWQPKVQTILNVTDQVAIACCVLGFLIGGAAMAIGRVTGAYQAGTRGLSFVLGAGAGALIIASAPAVVAWLIS